LGIVHDDDIRTAAFAGGERTISFQPATPFSFFCNPGVQGIALVVSKPLSMGSNALKNIMVILGYAEDLRSTIRNIPDFPSAPSFRVT